MIEIILTILVTALAIAAVRFYIGFRSKKKELSKKTQDLRKLLSQKKSSEIVLGQVAEKLVPFTDMFPHDPQRASFLGNPIDYIVFEEDEIVFTEIKSGNSRLTAKQRHIRDLIKGGKVRWEEIKIKPIKEDATESK